ncbi:head maturation protease, ClpP-related [Ligilactobacillus salivarius]|uniref:head maturation protease, ClpP-related n=1 Tax=Ligilactobacillus salivarius TaxID=1624 RepID=UPI001369950E|nr:head maturation protease, ClpP-related [Ligilactobacillus salivarius]MYU74910.1 Clp protease ClpP [Ligilactobacillus salivarius]
MQKIPIKGAIVDDDTAIFYDYFGMTCTSPKKVSAILDEEVAEGDDDIIVDIASNGGDVFVASEIYSMLKNNTANVKVNVTGLAASAASVIAMAGDTVSIAPTAQIMIHKAWTRVDGNVDDLNHEAGVLSGIDESIASAYELKTGMKKSDILQMMSNETWLTAQDAVDKGFADEIMFVNEDDEPVMNSMEDIPSKSAINKLMNLILKADKQQNKVTSQFENPSLKDKKLAILMERRK